MIIRYLSLIFIIFFVVTSVNLFIKPQPLQKTLAIDYDDPWSTLNKFYSSYLWRKINQQTDINDRFDILKKTINHNQTFIEGYNELCSSVDDYILAKIDIDEILAIIKKGIDVYNDEQYILCYLKVLRGLGAYSKSLLFLKESHEKTNDPYKKVWYLEKIKELIHEKNTIILTKSLEAYYQEHKKYPQEISLLVDHGFVDEIPEEPYGGQYFVAKQGQIRSTSERANKKQ